MLELKGENDVGRFNLKKDDEIDAILESAMALNMKRATDVWVGVYVAFCMEAKMEVEFTMCSGEELNEALCKFWPGLRTKKGDYYKRSSYFATRAFVY